MRPRWRWPSRTPEPASRRPSSTISSIPSTRRRPTGWGGAGGAGGGPGGRPVGRERAWGAGETRQQSRRRGHLLVHAAGRDGAGVMAPALARVCVVDDSASVRKGLSRLVTKAGYEAETFSSVRDFLARPSYDGPSCLVL